MEVEDYIDDVIEKFNCIASGSLVYYWLIL